jgi:hypothetical protein
MNCAIAADEREEEGADDGAERHQAPEAGVVRREQESEQQAPEDADHRALPRAGRIVQSMLKIRTPATMSNAP